MTIVDRVKAPLSRETLTSLAPILPGIIHHETPKNWVDFDKGHQLYSPSCCFELPVLRDICDNCDIMQRKAYEHCIYCARDGGRCFPR
jgi:hypothetical protein